MSTTCRVIDKLASPPDACGKPADVLLTFAGDETRIPACQKCAINLQQEAPKAVVKIERIV